MAAVEVIEFEEYEESSERPYLRLVRHPRSFAPVRRWRSVVPHARG